MLDHPGVVKALDSGPKSRLYIVLEWLGGRPLSEMLEDSGRLPPDRAVRVAIGIGEALQYIHAHGIVHRDLSPENVMVDSVDGIKLIDFGMARLSGSPRITFAGLSPVRGTLDYAAPEQLAGKRGDARSDIYAFGVILHQMLTGVVPSSAEPGKTVAEIAPALAAIVSHATERLPEDRYPNASECLRDLSDPERAALTRRSGPQRHARWSRAVLALAVLVLLAMFLRWYFS
jgi:serine/threonine-protein kinase